MWAKLLGYSLVAIFAGALGLLAGRGYLGSNIEDLGAAAVRQAGSIGAERLGQAAATCQLDL
ncbi:MAG: hypothetical protein VCA74_08825 [Deltaproteobacteria bacterium]